MYLERKIFLRKLSCRKQEFRSSYTKEWEKEVVGTRFFCLVVVIVYARLFLLFFTLFFFISFNAVFQTRNVHGWESSVPELRLCLSPFAQGKKWILENFFTEKENKRQKFRALGLKLSLNLNQIWNFREKF